MKSKQHIELSETYGAHNYHPLPVVLARGKGVWVWDVAGNKYLDCLSAYSAVNQGHCHPKILAAMTAQAKKLTLASRAFFNDQMGPLLKQLCTLSKMEMAILMNSGAEAVETAIKIARKWGYSNRKIPDNQAEIIVCGGNFHGRTTTIVGFSSEAQYKNQFGPFAGGFIEVPFGDLAALKAAITPRTVAFMMEPIQGEGGILFPPEGFLRQARALCKSTGILFMLDEIQTGLGRTGEWFAYQHETEAAKPDVLILGKALSGGFYPVSAVLASREVMGVLRPGDHGSTFGGNSLACAVAAAALDVIKKERLVQNSKKMGDYLMKKLRALSSPYIQDIRGRGLMVGIEIKKSAGKARPFCERLKDMGLLCKETHDQVIRLAPPLCITKKELDGAVEKIGRVLAIRF